MVMGWLITTERIPHEAAQAITAYVHSPLLGLLAINLFLVVVGMFLETLPALLILSPILLPVVKAFGIDPVHFGIVICFNLIIGIIGTFQVFTAGYLITDGGPQNATLFYVLYLYRQALQNFRMGYAAAMAWTLFLIIMLFTLMQLVLARRWVYYEGTTSGRGIL